MKADIDTRFDRMIQTMQNLLSGNRQDQTSAPTNSTADIMPSIESPNPPQQSNPPQMTLYQQVLKSKDVGFFNPDVSDEHGLGPVAIVSSDTVYRDIYTWVERLKDLVHIHGSDDVRQIIQPCLRGSAAT